MGRYSALQWYTIQIVRIFSISTILIEHLYSTLLILLLHVFPDLGDNYVDMKVSYCEDMLEIVEQLEGEKSRSRGLILSELLHTLDELVGRGGDIQDNLKFKIKKFKNEVMEILGEDAGAPININIYQNL